MLEETDAVSSLLSPAREIPLTDQLKYWAHIDGLRAIAVVSVVLFHVSAPVLPGGFAGVDIFFVISGYLIARIIYAEIETRTFSITQFWERRARRILPAFAVVTAATFVPAYLFLMPSEFEAFGRSVLAAVAFVPNVYFYLTADYFAPAAETMPALHYWSLGVEEQFYFIFPAAVLLITKFAPRLLPLALTALLLISLVASELALRSDPSAAFYWMPLRAYELLIGCILALPAARLWMPGERTGTIAAAAGLTAILAAFLLLSESSAFPGVAALVPAIGAGIVLWGCQGISNPVSRLLSWRPLVAIGLISYSLYLIHWPVILFAGRLFPHAHPVPRGIIAALLSVALAVISYQYVEKPFRHKAGWAKRSQVAWTSGIAAGLLTSLSAGVILTKGLPNRFDGRIAEILEFQNYDLAPQFRLGTCFLRLDQPGRDIDFARCLPAEDGKKRAILWGDSTAAHLYVGMRDLLEAQGYSLGQLTASACPPALGLHVPSRPKCQEFNDVVLPKIIQEKPDLVIMAANWGASDEVLEGVDISIANLRAAGVTPVVLGPGPIYRSNVPSLLAERLMRGESNLNSEGDLNIDLVVWNESRMKEHFSNRSDAKYVSVIDLLCPELQCPMMAGDMLPMHFDHMHLTPAGSKILGTMLAPRVLSD